MDAGVPECTEPPQRGRGEWSNTGSHNLWRGSCAAFCHKSYGGAYMVPGAEELGTKNQGREEPENKTTCALASEGGEPEKRERGRESTLSLGLLPLFVHKTEPGHEAKRRKERKKEGRREWRGEHQMWEACFTQTYFLFLCTRRRMPL